MNLRPPRPERGCQSDYTVGTHSLRINCTEVIYSKPNSATGDSGRARGRIDFMSVGLLAAHAALLFRFVRTPCGIRQRATTAIVGVVMRAVARRRRTDSSPFARRRTSWPRLQTPVTLNPSNWSSGQMEAPSRAITKEGPGVLRLAFYQAATSPERSTRNGPSSIDASWSSAATATPRPAAPWPASSSGERGRRSHQAAAISCAVSTASRSHVATPDNRPRRSPSPAPFVDEPALARQPPTAHASRADRPIP